MHPNKLQGELHMLRHDHMVTMHGSATTSSTMLALDK
jgi:hypothetical protein